MDQVYEVDGVETLGGHSPPAEVPHADESEYEVKLEGPPDPLGSPPAPLHADLIETSDGTGSLIEAGDGGAALQKGDDAQDDPQTKDAVGAQRDFNPPQGSEPSSDTQMARECPPASNQPSADSCLTEDRGSGEGRLAPDFPSSVSNEYDPNHWMCFDAPQSYLSALPPGSRLFIGNLASEYTDRTHIARIFAKYGNIIEISLKESYGFVQFDNPESCRMAIAAEQGRVIAGMMIDLKSSREKYPVRKKDVLGGYAMKKSDKGLLFSYGFIFHNPSQKETKASFAQILRVPNRMAAG